jgi:hypothetical protein
VDVSTPKFFAHRINTPEALAALPEGHGLELDLRVHEDAIVVAHDPFEAGPRMDDFLPRTGGRPLILNVKCEGIVDAVLECCHRSRLEDFFFLGLGLSDTVRLIARGERRIANYFSEFHHPEAPWSWAGRVNWLWMDVFSRYPGDDAHWSRLAETFRICVGSPELYGHPENERRARIESIAGRPFHAVCAKRTDPWLGPGRTPS